MSSPLYPISVNGVAGQNPNIQWGMYIENNKVYFTTVSPNQKLQPLPPNISSLGGIYNNISGIMSINVMTSNIQNSLIIPATNCVFQIKDGGNNQNIGCLLPNNNLDQLLSKSQSYVTTGQSNNAMFIILIIIAIILILFLFIRGKK